MEATSAKDYIFPKETSAALLYRRMMLSTVVLYNSLSTEIYLNLLAVLVLDKCTATMLLFAALTKCGH